MRLGSAEFEKSPERIKSVIAVSPFIVTQSGFFATVEELTNKRQTHKLAGMRSCPMETINPGETDQEALERAFQEELVVPQLTQHKSIPLCQIQFRPGFWLHAYLYRVDQVFALKIGSEVTEVANPRWTHINEALNGRPGERKFRPGVRQVVRAYLSFLEEGEEFQPRIHSSLENPVPEEVFDALRRVST